MHDKYRGGYSEPAIELRTVSPVGEIEKGPKELKGFAAPRRNNNMSHQVLPELPGTKPSTKEYTGS